jgi:ABC-2 type transport system permease protein
MRVLDIAFNDLLRSFRSWFAVGMMLVVPILITGLMYFAFSGIFAQQGSAPSLPVTKVVVVNLDQPAGGQHFGQGVVDFLKDEKLAELVAVTEMADEASARAALDRQQAGLAVMVPADFSAAVLSAERATTGRAALRLIQDPTLTTGPQIVTDLLSRYVDDLSGTKIMVAVTQAQAAHGGVPDASALNRALQAYTAWASAAEGGVAVQAPAASAASAGAAPETLTTLLAKTMAGMLVFFAFFTGANGAMSIVREDEEGTLARLFSTPTPRALVLGGKFAGVFILVGVQALMVMAASALIFKINWGQPASVGLLVLAQVAAASGVGVFIMSLVKTTRQAGPVLGGVLTGMGMAGGLFTSTIPNMPAAFNTVTLFTPQGWAMQAWKLALAGGGVAEIWVSAAVLVIMGAAFFGAGALLFRRRFAH